MWVLTRSCFFGAMRSESVGPAAEHQQQVIQLERAAVRATRTASHTTRKKLSGQCPEEAAGAHGAEGGGSGGGGGADHWSR